MFQYERCYVIFLGNCCTCESVCFLHEIVLISCSGELCRNSHQLGDQNDYWQHRCLSSVLKCIKCLNFVIAEESHSAPTFEVFFILAFLFVSYMNEILVSFRRVVSGSKLWETKDEQKWGHDKFEEMMQQERQHQESNVFIEVLLHTDNCSPFPNSLFCGGVKHITMVYLLSFLKLEQQYPNSYYGTFFKYNGR